MWIKVCGNTNLEDARFAAECGADALGFVFAPSPRQVQPAEAKSIIAQLPRLVEKYGVFVDASFDEIVATVETAGLTGVQLHRVADAALPHRLRERFEGRLAILRVVHYRAKEFEQQLAEFSAGEGVLVDSSSRHAAGGTGTSFDWAGARAGFKRAGSHLRLIAAGGLTPDNVKQAIDILRPWGVDAVSGLERAPGKKDPARVSAFIQSAQSVPVTSW
jgi:phosphoribosylanthranilate isomerase